MLVLAAPAAAQVIDIVWGPAGTFERDLNVPSGKFAELCGTLAAGQTVQWRFTASQAMDFNIHFHEGEAVRYPARESGLRASQGTLAVDSARDYCWMWTNKTAGPGGLRVQLQRR